MAGKLTSTTLQINDSATASNNFVLKADNLGGLKLSRGNDGATSQDILEVDTNGVVMMTQGSGRMVLGTAQATTSGTSIDFTGIPSWVKRITVMLNGVSTNGTSLIQVQLGKSAGIEVSGYAGSGLTLPSTWVSATTGFVLHGNNSAASAWAGQMILTLSGNNNWVESSIFSRTDGAADTVWSAGSKPISGTLDRIRLTTVNGTDTFDAGSVNIMYEG